MNQLFTHLLLVGLGGALGAMCRYGLGRWLGAWNPHPTFSVGILVANLLGCFVMGFLFVKVQPLEPALKEALGAFLLTGLLGGLTTYSSYALELVQLARSGAWKLLTAYFSVHLACGVAGIWSGMSLANLLASSVKEV